jgi:predicted nucleic acid-binding protein
MKRIFLDTNILIEYIDNRAGADAAEQIFACGFSDIPHYSSAAFVE